MSDLSLQLQGKPVQSLTMHASEGGTWIADCVMSDATVLTGKVSLTIGSSEYVGTIDPETSGAFAGATYYRVVGGGNGWGKPVSKRPYANDAGVKTLLVAQDAAAEVGESIGAFEPAQARFAAAYVRRECLASDVLEDAASGVPWWVGADGKTNVSTRKLTTPDPRLYHVDTWDPFSQTATIVVESASAIQIGSQLTDERWEGTLVVRDITLQAMGSSIMVDAWCGKELGSSARLAGLLKAFIQKTVDQRLLVRWRYRVESVAADGRLNLIALSGDAPFPSIRRVPQFAGAASAFSEPSPGAIVLVEFVEGDPSLPVCSPGSDTRDKHFVGKRLTLGGKPQLGLDIAYKGAPVSVLMPPLMLNGTVMIGGVPSTITGVMISSTGTTLGAVEAGSSKAGVAP